MTRSTHRHLKRRLRAGVLGIAAAGAALSGTALAAIPASAAAPAGRVFDVSTKTEFEQVLPTLTAGDTVKVEPGTYAVGNFRPNLVIFGAHAIGTAAAPITITAADPLHPPLITGAVKFDRLEYWNLSHLRFQGTIAGTPTLTFNSGNNWTLMDSEVFGARQTGALANLVVAKVSSAWPMPVNWVIADNAIHDAGATPSKAGTQHEIYLTAVGNAGHALIVRNLFYNTPDGAAVKLGNGGETNSPGISGVQVDNNTMYNNFEQVLLHGNVSNNSVRGNLMILSTRAQGDGGTVGVYLAGVTGKNNVIGTNYFYKVSKPLYNNLSTGAFINGGGNVIAANPRFNTAAPGQLRPATVKAQAYGAYARTNYWH